MMTDITHRAWPAQLPGTVSDRGGTIIITQNILDVKIYGFKIFCGNCRGIFFSWLPLGNAWSMLTP